MTTPKLDQAREWAEIVSARTDAADRALEAAKIIQSLPDEWIDAEKVAELADDMSNWRLPDGPSNFETNYLRLVEIMDGFIGRINELITPPLPTLADMTPEEREACQWMQAKIHRSDDLEGVIFFLTDDRAKIMFRDGTFVTQDHEDITPLPDLPRLEWPAQAPRNPETPPAETLNNTSSDTPRNPRPKWGPITLTPPTREEEAEVRKQFEEPDLPRPEDVPVGEAWLVKTRDGEKREALKTSTGWMVKDGDDVELWVEEALEPVARLVPEVQS